MDRKKIRIPGFDYASYGAYFITICTHERKHFFGRIVDDEVELSALGRLVNDHLAALSTHKTGFELGEAIIMPNHIHLVLFRYYDVKLSSAERAALKVLPITAIVGLLKSGITREWRKLAKDANAQVWQRGYYEHVIRTEDELLLCSQYILDNPLAWQLDRENALRVGLNPLYRRIGGVLR